MEIVTILGKSAAILTLFYVLYAAILRKDTFFTANRHYLLAGIIAALVFPFIEFTKTVYIDIPSVTGTPVDIRDFNPVIFESIPQETGFDSNWWAVFMVVYSVGIILFLGRLIVQLYSLKSLLDRYPSTKSDHFTFVQIEDNIAPFSFFRYICYNPSLHTEGELKMIIAHEKVHATQLHTVDVLFTQIVLALHWANPIAWLYKKQLEQNLEFLADSGALRAVHSSKAYQHALVKVSSATLRPALTNQFYHSLIKKRIVMLNKETSRRRNLWKLGLVLPLLGLFMYSFNVKEVIKYREAVAEEVNAYAKTNASSHYTEFQIDHTTTKAVLESIEKYFKNTYKSTEVHFTALRFKDGQLSGFDFQTKMKDDPRFITQFSYKSETQSITPFKIIPVKEHEILQIYQDGNQVRYTPEGSNSTLTLGENEATIGKDPIIVLNGSVIKDSSSKQTYTTPGAVKMVNPKEAIALYGKAASDGALVIENPSTRTGKPQKTRSFVINNITTDPEIKAMENYYKEYHPDALIEVYQVERDIKGEIQSYSLRTKFESTSQWNNILEVKNKNSVARGLQIRYLSGEIQLKELGPKGTEMRSSEKGLFIDDKTLGKGLNTLTEGLTTLVDEMENLAKSKGKDVLYHFTKNTTDTELDQFKATLKKEYGLDLSYTLRRNEKREITTILISYTGETENGNYSVNGDKPIKDFYFSIDDNTTTGFWSVSLKERIEKQEARREERRKIINERRELAATQREKISEKSQARREKIQSRMESRSEAMQAQMNARRQKLESNKEELKKSLAQIGQENDRGYVLLDDTTYYFVNTESGGTNFYNRYGEAIPDTDFLYKRLIQNKNEPVKFDLKQDMSLRLENFSEKPLYILDGIELTERPIINDPNTIKNISILKGNTATSIYGDKGKNGVVVIELKKI